jgi:hypothetical protein
LESLVCQLTVTLSPTVITAKAGTQPGFPLRGDDGKVRGPCVR